MKFLRVFVSLYLLHQTFATPTQLPPTPTKADVWDLSGICATSTTLSVLGAYKTPVYSPGLFPSLGGSPRIQALCPTIVADKETRRLLEKVPNHLMGTLSHAPAFMPGLNDLFRAIVDSSQRKIPLHDAVVVILRTAWKIKCEYIFRNWLHLHDYLQKHPDYLRGGFQRSDDSTSLAKLFTMSAEAIAAGDGPFDLRQRALIKMVDEQVDLNRTNSNSTMAELLSNHLASQEVVEALVMHGLIGTYCSVLKGLRVEIDPNYSVANMVDTGVRLDPDDRKSGISI